MDRHRLADQRVVKVHRGLHVNRKVTDLLYLCHHHTENGLAFGEIFAHVRERFCTLCAGLDLAGALDSALDDVEVALSDGTSADFAASRGEYLSGRLLASLLDAEFVDAAEVICFDTRGRFDAAASDEQLRTSLMSGDRAVVPGFYGSRADGIVRTFSRGGSDITGAVVARAVGASVYENWSDVPGLLMADPEVVPDALPIETLTYRELRELAYMGASVLHDEAIFPVREAEIPVHIRSTWEPAAPGTRIVKDEPASIIVPEGEQLKRIDHMERLAGESAATRVIRPVITGIAGRKDFTVITLTKALMNKQKGFGRRLLEVIEDHDIIWEHMPSGIDTVSVVVETDQVAGQLDAIVTGLRSACKPDHIEVASDMALIASVGRGIMHTPGIAGRLFSALADAGVNVRMIDQGSGEMNIIVGVHSDQFERAVQAIYDCFVRGGAAQV